MLHHEVMDLSGITWFSPFSSQIFPCKDKDSAEKVLLQCVEHWEEVNVLWKLMEDYSHNYRSIADTQRAVRKILQECVITMEIETLDEQRCRVTDRSKPNPELCYGAQEHQPNIETVMNMGVKCFLAEAPWALVDYLADLFEDKIIQFLQDKKHSSSSTIQRSRFTFMIIREKVVLKIVNI